jgi:hypothetical protein
MAEKTLSDFFTIVQFQEAVSCNSSNRSSQIAKDKTSASFFVAFISLLLLLFVLVNSSSVQAQSSPKSKKQMADELSSVSKLKSFEAVLTPQGTLIKWQTDFEKNTLGFNIYREADGKRVLVNQQLILGSVFKVGSGASLNAGDAYKIFDNFQTQQTAIYWIEAINLRGESKWDGPFTRNLASQEIAATEIQQARNDSLQKENYSGSRPQESSVKLVKPTAQELKTQGLSNSEKAWKFAVKNEGWYSISQQQILGSSLNTSINPNYLQLFVDGQAQPIFVRGEDDGRLDVGDTVEFYGQGIDSPFCEMHTYWLVLGQTPGMRIGKTAAVAASSSANSFPYSVQRKDRTIYFSSLLNGERENFFGAVIARNPLNQSLQVKNLDASSTQMATLKVTLQGVTWQPHIITVEINGQYAGELYFEYQYLGDATFNFPCSYLQEGDNVVTLTPNGGNSDVSLVDTLRLTYQHLYQAENNCLRFSANSGEQITIWGFSSDAIEVYDITNAAAVKALSGGLTKRAIGQETEFGVSLTIQGTGTRQLLALTKNTCSSVMNFCLDSPSTLHSNLQGADFVIITKKNFFPAVEALKALREKQGLSVALVDVEDIYDEFCFGQKTPQAIKDFLSFARNNWRNPPRYTLFFGDASFDTKNYLGAGDFDIVPTKLVDTLFMETASDDWLADFNEDGIADLAVGRLSVRNETEANNIVSKLLAYDQSQPSKQVLMVSDIGDVYDFESTNDSLLPLLPKGSEVTFVKRRLMSDQDARNMILEKLNQGPRIVNYAGHGQIDYWRGYIFSATDARSLQNSKTYPVFVIMNCLNGFFQDPYLEGLAESVVKASNGGAVAAWASSALTFADGQVPIDQEFYRQLFGNRSIGARIGDAAIRAKAKTTDMDTRRSWILFADPTMRMK